MLDKIEGWSSLGVSSVLTKALLEQNFYSPTIIQALTIPPAILGRRDILGAAETGSGKTLAFGIPVLNGILELKKKTEKNIKTTSGNFKEINKDKIPDNWNGDNKDENQSEFKTEKKLDHFDKNSIGLVKVINNVKFDFKDISKTVKPLYALILTPTRELANQIRSHLLKAAKYTNIKIAIIVGGLAAVKQERILNKGPEIVIATPGRLWELIDKGNSHLSQIDSLRYLVIDETDKMLEKGHFLELHKIIERINSKESKLIQRQVFLFSATLTLMYDIPDYLQRNKVKNSKIKDKILKSTSNQKMQKVIEIFRVKRPKIIDVTKVTGTATNLTECRIICTIDHKDYYLYYFLKRHSGRTIIFCNSIGCVKRLTTLCGILDCNPLPLHASMPQRQRLKNLERFQSDYCGLLIATDVAARGLDISYIEHVIHYQVPRTSESYIHRSGRTARAQKEGITILMMEPSETKFYSRLCKTLNRTEDLPVFPIIDCLLDAIKERVNIAREIDKLELACRKENFRKGWLEKASKEMDILLDDKEFENTKDVKKKTDLKRLLKIKKNHLSNLIKKTLFPKRSGNCFGTSIEISVNQNSQKAVDVMKKAIGENSKLKKTSLSIY